MHWRYIFFLIKMQCEYLRLSCIRWCHHEGDKRMQKSLCLVFLLFPSLSSVFSDFSELTFITETCSCSV